MIKYAKDHSGISVRALAESLVLVNRKCPNI